MVNYLLYKQIQIFIVIVSKDLHAYLKLWSFIPKVKDSKRSGLLNTILAWSIQYGLNFNLKTQKELFGYMGLQSNMRLGWKEKNLVSSIPNYMA